MYTELYYYAKSSSHKIPTLTISTIVCILLVLLVFLIPILEFNIWIGFSIFLVYFSFIYIYKKIKNAHDQTLLTIGTFLFLLGLELLLLVYMFHNFIKWSLFVIFICITLYEAIFLLKLKLRIYSRGVKNKKTISGVITGVCGLLGIFLGKCLNIIIDATTIKWGIVALLSSLVIVCSITFFQKYIVKKILQNKNDVGP